MIKISVVIPCYNHAKYIGDAIRSVLSQTYRNIEVFVFDNGSQDNSWEVINSFEDDRLTKIQLSVNDMLEVKQQFVKRASGEYYAILYSDDVWEISKLEEQVKYIQENDDVNICFTWAKQVGEDLEPIEGYIDHTSYFNKTRREWLMEFVHKYNSISCPSVVMKKELYEKYFAKLYPYRQIADMYCWLKILEETNLHVVEKILVRQRVHVSGNNINESARTKNNLLREISEINNAFFKVIDEMSDDYFYDVVMNASGEKSHINILCRKFLFIRDELSSVKLGRKIEENFYYKYFDYSEDGVTFYQYLARHYNYTRNDFFEFTGSPSTRDAFLEDRISRWAKLENTCFDKLSGLDKSIVLYGCGQVGKALARRLLPLCNVKCFVDRAPAIGDYCGIPVIALDSLRQIEESLIVIIPTYDYESIVEEMRNKLEIIDSSFVNFDQFIEMGDVIDSMF